MVGSLPGRKLFLPMGRNGFLLGRKPFFQRKKFPRVTESVITIN